MKVWVVIYTDAFEEYDNPIAGVQVFAAKPPQSVYDDCTVLEVREEVVIS